MTTFDDLLPGDDTQRDQRPAARHRADHPSLTASLGNCLCDAWRAATARDVPTSTPTGVGDFRRIWRTTWS